MNPLLRAAYLAHIQKDARVSMKYCQALLDNASLPKMTQQAERKPWCIRCCC